MKIRRSIPLVAGVLALALALAAPAFAQTPAQSAYSSVAATQLSATSPGNAATSAGNASNATATTNASSLPFTGLDVGGVVLAAVVLGGTGVALRRWTRSSTN